MVITYYNYNSECEPPRILQTWNSGNSMKTVGTPSGGKAWGKHREMWKTNGFLLGILRNMIFKLWILHIYVRVYT